MPRNQFQKLVYAFLTVIVTVNAFVFYNLYVVNGAAMMAATHEKSVLRAINHQGGVYIFGNFLPIWAVILTEFIFAYTLEIFMGSPKSFKMASKMFNPKETNPVVFELAIICCTVAVMCPAMSFIAAFLYYPYYEGFNILTFLASYIKLVCFNFPFAFFGQIFFIQPLIRRVFGLIFKKDIESRKLNVMSVQNS